jgi:hypothetical protein
MRLMWIAGLALLLAAAAEAGSQSDVMEVKSEDGRIFGVILLCNDCRTPDAKGPCHTGAEDGWLNGKPCGKCLLESNHEIVLKYPFDIHVVGKLVDAAGKPVKERFIKMFLPNGWGVRTRTMEDGSFRLMLGATADRESKQPLITDVGTRVDSEKGADPHYALFFMPQQYAPCAAAGQPKPAEKRAPGTATEPS